MEIIGIAAYTAEIVHTYTAREKLIKGTKVKGHECRIETQGTTGTEYKLTEQEIAKTDVVILAVDVEISGEERFKGKPMIHVDTAAVIKSVVGFIEKVEKTIENKG